LLFKISRIRMLAVFLQKDFPKF